MDKLECSYCGSVCDDDEIFTTGDPFDSHICIDCIETAEELRSFDLADAFHRARFKMGLSID